MQMYKVYKIILEPISCIRDILVTNHAVKKWILSQSKEGLQTSRLLREICVVLCVFQCTMFI